MKLADLEPKFIVYTERGYRHVPTLAEAQGIVFLCPQCFAKNDGSVGTHAVGVSFAGRGVRDDQGSRGNDGKPTRWAVSGSVVADLTLSPSVDLGDGDWHGFVKDGAIT